MNKILTRDFVFLVLSTTLIACANFDLTASIAVYAKLITHSGTYIGLIIAAFYIGSVGARVGCGELIQAWGARRLMLISAYLCIAVCLAHSFAVTISLLVFLRILHGVGYSVFSTASGTATSYIVPVNRISEGMGYYMLSSVLAMALGPALALMIISRGTVSQFHTLFNVTAAICAAALLFVYTLAPDKKPSPNRMRPEDETADNTLPKTFLGFEKGVVLPVIVSFLMTFAYSPVFVYLAMYGLGKGWTHVGIGFAMYAVGLCISRLFSGRISDRYGSDYVMFPAYVCGIVALAIIGLSPVEWPLFPAMVLMGVCIGSYNPEIIVFCISRCSLPRRGSALAAFNGSADIGLAAGSLVGGVLIDAFGFPLTLLSGAALCLATLGIYSLTLSRFAKAERA